MKAPGIFFAAALSGFSLLLQTSAQSSPKPANLGDGRYACAGMMGGLLATFGYVDIKGHTYRGPSITPSGAFAAYTVSVNGALTWSHGFGEVNKDGFRYQSSTIMPDPKPFFRVKFTTPDGSAEEMDCQIE